MNLDLNKITKEEYEDFVLEEDTLISYECEDCGCNNDVLDVFSVGETSCCEDCGGDNIIPYTSHEDLECDCCDKTFSLWEDWFTSNQGNICIDCYNKLEDKYDK